MWPARAGAPCSLTDSVTAVEAQARRLPPRPARLRPRSQARSSPVIPHVGPVLPPDHRASEQRDGMANPPPLAHPRRHRRFCCALANNPHAAGSPGRRGHTRQRLRRVLGPHQRQRPGRLAGYRQPRRRRPRGARAHHPQRPQAGARKNGRHGFPEQVRHGSIWEGQGGSHVEVPTDLLTPSLSLSFQAFLRLFFFLLFTAMSFKECIIGPGWFDSVIYAGPDEWVGYIMDPGTGTWTDGRTRMIPKGLW